MGLFGRRKAAEAALAAENALAESRMNDEFVSVIMAAIAAYESEQYVQKLYIRKLNRTAGIRPVWGATGTNEAIDVRRI